MDIKIINVKDIIPVSSVGIDDSYSTPTLRITGSDFRFVDSVFINEKKSPEIVVLSKREMLVQVPDESDLEEGINNVRVIGSVYTGSRPVKLGYSLNNKKISGSSILVQRFLKILLTSPGTDIYSPEIGEGIQRIIGSNVVDESALSQAISKMIKRVDSTLTSIQKDTDPDTARLKQSEILYLSTTDKSTSVSVGIELTNQAGNTVLLETEVSNNA